MPNGREQFKVRVVDRERWPAGLTQEVARVDESSLLAHPFQTEPFVALFNTDPDRPHYVVIAEDAEGLAAFWWGYFARYNDGLLPRSNAWLRSGPVLRADVLDRRDIVLSSMLSEWKKHLGRQGVGRGLFTSEAFYGGACDGGCLANGLGRYDLQTYLVDLAPAEEELSKRLDQRSRWSSNKARRNGITIDDAVSDEDLRTYYRLYAENGAVPGSGAPGGDRFVAGVQRLRDEGKARVTLARDDGRVVAGSFFLCHGSLVAQLQTATNGEGRRLNAGSLLLWESMLSFKSAGFRALDLISVEVAPPAGSREAGVRDFKSKWGGRLLDTPVYRYQSPVLQLWKAVRSKIRGLSNGASG